MHKRGALLVETVIAIFILALVGFSILEALPIQRRFEQQGLQKERLWSVCLSQGEVWRTKALSIGSWQEPLQAEGRNYEVTRSIVASDHDSRWLLTIRVDEAGSKVEACWVVPAQRKP